ncbi:MAG: hypothetical protein ACJ8AH_02490, partial [Stellaceae bacterium]
RNFLINFIKRDLPNLRSGTEYLCMTISNFSLLGGQAILHSISTCREKHVFRSEAARIHSSPLNVCGAVASRLSYSR